MTYVEEEVPESVEVVEYRLSQLCDFLEGALPSMFSSLDSTDVSDRGEVVIHSKITSDDLIAVLEVMEEEFTPTLQHGLGLVRVIQREVSDCLEDVLVMVQEDLIESEEFDEDDPLCLMVEWGDVFPSLEGDIGLLFEAAGISASLFLSAGVHNDPEYYVRACDLMRSLSNTYSYYKGSVMFLLVFSYILISKYKAYPAIQQMYPLD